ncbi:BNR repeat-containing protein [Demequina capsici]|uniref:BNR repeat-containing protein n=1 Tax=Demequina capsici TaxID=3075620 RepID=A0AA96F5E0_9MICO|nr:BNR repeat-containing protein [Demequina sp. OYTSA14]WNM24366.1 BNR repeat-containing protein [Demequina sp. OYTSA14]
MAFDDAVVVEASALSDAWAGTSVNATSFRRNASVVGTYAGKEFEAVAYYDAAAQVVLARRDEGASGWTVSGTGLYGDPDDAHNVISLGVDGNGTLHLAWGVHNAQLRYATSAAGGRGAFVRGTILGDDESRVTYPQFYARSDGGLYLMYRDGVSGNGTVVLDRFDATTLTWSRIATSLISGDGERSPYWEAVVDSQDRLHVMWTWRDTPDVASNHDIMYAVAADDTGLTWTDSSGAEYDLPITADTAEVAVAVPQGSNLMNQTGLTVDADDRPYLATYWAEGGITQYRVVTRTAAPGGWTVLDTGIRNTTFEMAGAGTKALPLARPDIAVSGSGTDAVIHLLIRDDERDGAFSIATSVAGGEWHVRDVTAGSDLGWWEPTYDRDAWRRQGLLTVYVQRLIQTDGDSGAPARRSPAYLVTVDPAALT